MYERHFYSFDLTAYFILYTTLWRSTQTGRNLFLNYFITPFSLSMEYGKSE